MPAENDARKNAAQGMIRPTFTFKKRGCKICEDKSVEVDYKDVATLKKYTTDVGKIVGRKKSGLCAKHQRSVANAIKRARFMALMPFSVKVEY
jgi:small subunit ribosomal protein S18